MKVVKRLVYLVVGLLFSALLLTTVLAVGIWPGEVKLLAPVLCSDGQPDAFVVTDTYSDSDGQSTNFTMYCVGETGDSTDRGYAAPFALLTLIHAGILLAIVLILSLAFRLRRAVAGDEDEDEDDAPSASPPDSAIPPPNFSGPIIS